MTRVKLVDGTIIEASEIKLENGVLLITTRDKTVEELDTIFSNPINTNIITLMTDDNVETSYQKGFTSFAGINYNADKEKTIQLIQPANDNEARLTEMESTINELEKVVDVLLGVGGQNNE